MLVLKICCSEWQNENRDMRELSVCKDLGADVVVLAKGLSSDRGRVEDINGFQVRRYTTRPITFLPTSINRLLSIVYWSKFARKIDADVISGHDLFGLTIGWLSNVFKHKKAKLIYDSHEFELGRNKKRNKFATYMIKIWEHKMIQASSAIVMVNDCIAEEVKRIHRLNKKPIVVRNIPNCWNIDKDICMQTRRQIITGFGKRIEKVIMYHGVVGSGRGIEHLLYAIKDMDNVGLFILGNILCEDYGKQLSSLIDNLNIRNQVYIHEAVRIDDLWKYVGAADVGMCYIVPVTKSYYYALPNKLFENIQALTPVIVSDLPELKKIVSDYNVGLVCENGNVNALKFCIDQMLTNTIQYNEFVASEQTAKMELCWEKERDILVELYSNMFEGA